MTTLSNSAGRLPRRSTMSDVVRLAGVSIKTVSRVADPFYSGPTRAAEEVARRFGRQVHTGSSGEDAGRERELALGFCARRVPSCCSPRLDGDRQPPRQIVLIARGSGET